MPILKTIRRAKAFRDDMQTRAIDGVVDGTVYAIRRSTGGRTRNLLLLFGGLNLLLWLIDLLFAGAAYRFVVLVFEIWSNAAIALLAIPFGTAMTFVYILIRAKLPDVEEVELDSDVMASFDYNSKSQRRTLTWIAAAAGGTINTAAMIIVNLMMNNAI